MASAPFRNTSSSETTCFSLPPSLLLRLSSQVSETLEATPYIPPESSSPSIKAFLQSLLPSNATPSPSNNKEHIKNFFLCLATIESASDFGESPTLGWISTNLISSAKSALQQFRDAGLYGSVGEMVADLFAEIVPDLKRVIKETCADTENEEEITTNNVPVGYSILAAYQFRWMVSQVVNPLLGNFCWLVIPCALTALDHWSPEVKKQGMFSFIHIANNVSTAEFSLYEEAVLDACCRNIPASDELWHHVVEVSVLLLTYTRKSNPRSPWFDRILSEMLGHLERQPFNKERRTAWLSLIEPVFDAMGLFLLAHFRRLFYLFFQWMHSDDDQTVILVLERLNAIVKLTWIRKSPHTERLVDELVLIYKESATRKNREVLRSSILELLSLLQRCKGVQFESTWEKHTKDPDLVMLISSFNQHQMQIMAS
ncbi:ARM repeat superfamily protein [Rhynchospora pubera]|uniref:ARM repeat superfamily protein n=1 Tax=Rhynchospora pubera TaxID=906938 RepID=A0AAV8FNF9_9POAL|nr:ARM repeat superfamily protein [Rhynchospora pubera]